VWLWKGEHCKKWCLDARGLSELTWNETHTHDMQLSRLHFDAYENLVFQIAGSKTFTIFDPSQLPFVTCAWTTITATISHPLLVVLLARFLYPTELHEYQTTSSRHNWDKEVVRTCGFHARGSGSA